MAEQKQSLSYKEIFDHKLQNDLFLVDGHITVSSVQPPDSMPAWNCTTTIAPIYKPAALTRAVYGMYGFPNINVYWPIAWLVECGAPAPNQYGWLPSAEFGIPVFNGDPLINKDITVREPFQYKNTEGKMVTPSLPYNSKDTFSVSPSVRRKEVEQRIEAQKKSK
jgi:hypothetical protein